MGAGTAVSIVNSYGLVLLRFGVRFPAGAETFFFTRPDRFLPHGYCRLSSAQGPSVTHCHLVLRLKVCRLCLYTAPVFVAWCLIKHSGTLSTFSTNISRWRGVFRDPMPRLVETRF
jgi:hypothetical protein